MNRTLITKLVAAETTQQMQNELRLRRDEILHALEAGTVPAESLESVFGELFDLNVVIGDGIDPSDGRYE